jgi:TM2 domain-containing membrane protein YozV
MEEKMDNNTVENKKSPLGAVILSALFPGLGFFYLGNFIKGITYMSILAALIVLASHSTGAQIPVYVLICVGFYIYQIFDCSDEAAKLTLKTGTEKEKKEHPISLSAAVAILILGIVLQLAVLEVISFREVLRLWPLILIAIGFKYVYIYMKSKEITKGGSNE